MAFFSFRSFIISENAWLPPIFFFFFFFFLGGGGGGGTKSTCLVLLSPYSNNPGKNIPVLVWTTHMKPESLKMRRKFIFIEYRFIAILQGLLQNSLIVSQKQELITEYSILDFKVHQCGIPLMKILNHLLCLYLKRK